MIKETTPLEYLNETLRLGKLLDRHIRRVVKKHNAYKTELELSHFLFVKNLKSLGAVQVLWEEGFSQDAIAITRMIFEACVQDVFIRTNRVTLSERYYAHEIIARRNLSCGVIRSSKDERISSKWVASARKYGRLAKASKLDFDESRGWSGKSVREITRMLDKKYGGFWADYEFFYIIASSIVHSSALSVQEYMRVDSVGKRYRLLSARRKYMAETPILASSWTLAVGLLSASDHNLIAQDFDLALVSLQTMQWLETLKWALDHS